MNEGAPAEMDRETKRIAESLQATYDDQPLPEPSSELRGAMDDALSIAPAKPSNLQGHRRREGLFVLGVLASLLSVAVGVRVFLAQPPAGIFDFIAFNQQPDAIEESDSRQGPFSATDIDAKRNEAVATPRTGFLAAQMSVSQSSGGHVRPGDVVDVHFTSKERPAERGIPGIPSKMIKVASSVRVLREHRPQQSELEVVVGYPAKPPVFTLEVSPTIATNITTLTPHGEFSLVKRASNQVAHGDAADGRRRGPPPPRHRRPPWEIAPTRDADGAPIQVANLDSPLEVSTLKSKPFKTDAAVSRFAVEDLQIADIIQFAPTEFEIVGLAEGETELKIWQDAAETQAIRYRVVVKSDDSTKTALEELEDRINELFPNSAINLTMKNGKVVIGGKPANEIEAAQIVAIVAGESVDQSGNVLGQGSNLNLGTAAQPYLDESDVNISREQITAADPAFAAAIASPPYEEHPKSLLELLAIKELVPPPPTHGIFVTEYYRGRPRDATQYPIPLRPRLSASDQALLDQYRALKQKQQQLTQVRPAQGGNEGLAQYMGQGKHRHTTYVIPPTDKYRAEMALNGPITYPDPTRWEEHTLRRKKFVDVHTARMTGYVPDIDALAVRNKVLVDPVFPTAVEAPSGDRFDHIHEDHFKTVEDHPLSTFSIDVDTASYSKTRQYLNSGQLPPPDAVRIEELVNYFAYDYLGPMGADPFTAHMEVAQCPWRPVHRLARIAIKGREIQRDRRPLSNLVLLLDVSGSMNSANKLPLVKKGVRMLVNELGENDRVAIVVYAGAAGLVLPSTPGDQKAKIDAALDKMQAGGSTAGAAGIQLAYQTARENFIDDGVNRVLLCTDGDFNVGVSDTGSLVRLAEKEAKDGVFLSVLGFGMGNHNDAMLEQVSGKANGAYAFIDTEKEARKVFVEQLSGTLVTIAKDVKIQIEFNPAKVKGYRLIGYENRILAAEDFNDDKKDAGEIGAGHTVTALYEIIPADAKEEVDAADVDELKYQQPAKLTDAADSDELLTLKLRYKEPDADKSKPIAFPVDDDTQHFGKASDDFQFAAAVASFGMLLRGSRYAGDANFDAVLEIAESSQGEDRWGYRKEFLELVKKAKDLTP